MIQVAYTNIQSKIKIYGLLSDSFTMIKGDHEIEIVNFADDTTIFLRDFSCLNQKELILKLCEKASSSKIIFSKRQTLLAGTYKYRIHKPRQLTWLQFSIKIVEVLFGNSAHDNRSWDKI